jgi:cytochrome c biogenesis protein CcmG/thiol:disulfide interchange protein DsbE
MKQPKTDLGWIIILCLSIAGASLLSCSEEQGNASTSHLQLAPDFTLNDINGRSGKLSDYRGKVLILDFWATWCGPCRMLIPHFKSLYDQYKGSGFEVIGVAMDHGGAKIVKPFVEQHDIRYPNFIGNNDVAMNYGGLRGIPTTFVLTRDGRIYKRYVGVPPDPRNTFETDIKTLLARK